MKIKLKHCADLGDWYAIVRVEHDGREWTQELDHSHSQWMMSERLTPNACIEGDSEEMISIAYAIKGRTDVSFKRCAVSMNSDGVHFYSPRNSTEDAIISVEDAAEFADHVLIELAAQVSTQPSAAQTNDNKGA